MSFGATLFRNQEHRVPILHIFAKQRRPGKILGFSFHLSRKQDRGKTVYHKFSCNFLCGLCINSLTASFFLPADFQELENILHFYFVRKTPLCICGGIIIADS